MKLSTSLGGVGIGVKGRKNVKADNWEGTITFVKTSWLTTFDGSDGDNMRPQGMESYCFKLSNH